jgi:2,3-bisphosphoglycerate-dependent phosphoglycerate mutase
MIKYILILLLSSAAFSGFTQQQQPITTVILVRHAEKENDGTKDPDLSVAGIERANRLASLFKKTRVDAVYSTPYKRTQHTVKALAEAKGLAILMYDPLQLEAVENILLKHRGGTIVLCGHSNTIPQIANLFVGKEEFKNFDESDYSNILILSVVEKGKQAKITWLTY